MKDSAKLRRQLYLIRHLDKPYTYPTLEQLSQHLHAQDISYASEASVERDLRAIRSDYDITITYDRRKRGYFLDLPDDEDVSDFRQFVRLLERRERLEVLTNSGRLVGHYLQLEQNDGFRGIDLLTPIWNALQRRLVITFTYQAYNNQPAEQRRVEPGLLFEYRNRWYLDGWDLERNGQRTFGLDRINELVLTPHSVQADRHIDYRAARQQVIGVTAPIDKPVERVVLRFKLPEAEYVRSLPLHTSQRIEVETPTTIDFVLHVVVNHELEREIMAYGEEVEVLEPDSLRRTIGARLNKAAACYHT